MAKKKPTRPGDQSQPVYFTKKDAARIANVVHHHETSSRPRNPSFLPRAPGGGGGSPIRLGQFTGPWVNEPGETGADNVKLVKLYVQPDDAGSANDWVPELDGDGEEVIAVTLNLFSYIPTRSGNDSYMWCAVIPISSVEGEYWSGGYDSTGGSDVPIMKPYTQLWLLLAAEC